MLHDTPQPTLLPKSTSRPIKRHGGKRYLADWIISKIPPRVQNSNAPAAGDTGWVHYVEPFFGAGSVMFAMDPHGISEVANDLDGELSNFWHVLQSPILFPALEHQLRNTPCSQYEFERSLDAESPCDPVERAARLFIRNRQSRQALEQGFATLVRNRTRSGMNELASAWLSSIEGLPEFHARLQRVVILNKDACDVICQQDGPRTLFYCDPPYVHSTRGSVGQYGAFEMDDAGHQRLLETLAAIEGRFLLSGYHSPLYDEFAAANGWVCHELAIDNKASSAKEKEKKIECLWGNYRQ